jgi:protein gp37
MPPDRDRIIGREFGLLVTEIGTIVNEKEMKYFQPFWELAVCKLLSNRVYWLKFLFCSEQLLMAETTGIEWTDATWNPVTGCTKISPGCDHCYAERFSERFRSTPGHPFERGFDLTLRPERLDQPLRWRTPRMIFVNSMSDLFHKEIPKDFVERVFDTMEAASWHTFQVLTKRSSLMCNFLRKRYLGHRAPFHIWFGVSVEDGTKTSRIRHLREAPASVRFLSVEPLIGPVGKLDLTDIDWVIVGGESGPGARPMKEEWAVHIRNLCIGARVPFFFKQWGGRTPKTGGRLLDGEEWSQFPTFNQPRDQSEVQAVM